MTQRCQIAALSLHRQCFLLILAVALLCACVPDSAALPTTPTAPDAVTLTFGALAREQPYYTPLIAAFNAQHSDIRVQFVALDELGQGEQGEALDVVTLVRRIVSAADTAFVNTLPPDAVTHGYVANLQPLIDADSSFDRADYYPHALFSPTGGNDVYLLPRTLRVPLLAYNKDLWALNKLPEPQPGWTWADLLAAAAQVAKRRDDVVDIYGLVDWDGGVTALASVLDERGVKLLHVPTSADPPRFDQPPLADALAQFAALVQSGAIHTGESEHRPTIIADGRAGIWRTELLLRGSNQPPPRFAIGAATVPQASVTLFPPSSAGYVMSAGTQHTQAAWRWLSFLSRQSHAATGSRDIPARRSLADQSGYWRDLDAETVAAVRATLERPAPVLTATYDAQMLGPLRKALNDVIGGKDPRDALAEAQIAFNQALAQRQSAPNTASESGPPIVATPFTPAEGVTRITFRTPGQNASTFQRAARDFNERNPDVFVEVKGNATTRATKFKEMAESADCFLWWGPPTDDADAALDVQPLLDADATFPRDDYPAALLAPFRRGTTLVGLPHEVRLRVLAYNRTLFESAQLDSPNAQWTLGDLRNAAQQLTLGSGETQQYGYAVSGLQTSDLLFFLARSGVNVTTGSGEATAPNYTDPAVGLALRGYRDLIRSSTPHTQLTGYSQVMPPDSQAFTLVGQGRVAMWLDESSATLFAPQRAGQQLGVAPPPLGGLPLTPDDASATGLYIAAQTPHPQACWAWLKHLSGDVTALRQGFPARRSVAMAEAFTARAAPGAADVYRAYRDAFDRAPTTSAVPQAFNRSRVDFYWLFRAMDRALQGNDLDRELAAAQDTTQQFLACLRGGGKGGECARQVDPNYSGLRGDE